MDFVAVVRMLGALGVVLGMLAGALWVVRRYNIRLPGGMIRDEGGKRVALVDRTGIDARRSVALIRRDGREHLILLAPEGNMLIETAILRDEIDAAAAEARAAEARERALAAEQAAAEAQERMRAAMAELRTRSLAAARRLGNGLGRATEAVKGQENFRDLVSGVIERSGAIAEKIAPARIRAAAPPPSPPPPPPAEPAPKKPRARTRKATPNA